MATYNYKPGLGNAASYQVSGIPYVTGTIDVAAVKGVFTLSFPSVTSWVSVAIADNQTCAIGFASGGVESGNRFLVKGPDITPRFEVKITELHLSGSSTDVSVMAGLTYIDNGSINNSAISPSGSNWSGSLAALVG
tara:strand:- start:571 stop:978 length:408 start_codon:yes stop_codon:yes gene_type:complete